MMRTLATFCTGAGDKLKISEQGHALAPDLEESLRFSSAFTGGASARLHAGDNICPLLLMRGPLSRLRGGPLGDRLVDMLCEIMYRRSRQACQGALGCAGTDCWSMVERPWPEPAHCII